MGGKSKGTAIFVASACVSLVVLGGLLLLFMLYVKAARAEAVKNDVVHRSTYLPAESESLAVVLLGCRKAESLPDVVALLDYDAPAGNFSIVTIPSNAVCTLNGRTDTVAGHYDYEGVRGAVNAVSELLGVEVDRYLRTQQAGLSNLVDFLGGVLYTVGEAESGENQLLDGRQVTELLFEGKGNRFSGAGGQAELSELLFKGGFTSGFSDRYDAFAKAVFYNCETNLSQYDFVLRKKGFTTYLEAESLIVRGMALEGKRSGEEFLPSEEGVKEIAEILNGVAA